MSARVAPDGKRLTLRAAFRDPATTLLVAVALFATALRIRYMVTSDTWFNLVIGREIVTGGLVVRNDLTEQGFGSRCVDQQWLAHLFYHAIATHLGLPGVATAAATLTVAAFLLAIWFARSSGATPGRVLAVGLVAFGAINSQSAARAQTLALPFEVLFCWVLAEDARSPSRRTWWLLPCAGLWANLHGSVLLAPGMAILALAARIVDAWRRGEAPRPGAVFRDSLLALSLLAAVFVSPYATELPSYYRSTAANPAFRLYMPEWQPPTASDLPVFLLIAAVLAVMARSARVMPTFDGSILLLLAIGSLSNVRHATLLALAATALLPRWADLALGRSFRVDPDRFLARAAFVGFPFALLAFAAIPLLARWCLPLDSPVEFTDRVRSALGSRGRVLADELLADRLLWFHPDLAGRVSHDARVEVIPLDFLRALAGAYSAPGAQRSQSLLAEYDVIVVDRDEHPTLFRWMKGSDPWVLLASDPRASAFVRRQR
jgi:hypothetical protein